MSDKREQTLREKQSFAIVNALRYDFHNAGLTEDDVWAFVKNEHNVESRTELTEEQWAVLAARLHTAQHDSKMFDVLCENIRESMPATDVDRPKDVIIEQRENVKYVDVKVWHSTQMYSSCLVNLDTNKVRGRKMDLLRISEKMTGECARSMSDEMIRKSIIKHVTAHVSVPAEPTPETVEGVLITAAQWLTVDRIGEALNTENGEAILAALRVLYQQKKLAYRQIGASDWFRFSEGGKA